MNGGDDGLKEEEENGVKDVAAWEGEGNEHWEGTAEDEDGCKGEVSFERLATVDGFLFFWVVVQRVLYTVEATNFGWGKRLFRGAKTPLSSEMAMIPGSLGKIETRTLGTSSVIAESHGWAWQGSLHCNAPCIVPQINSR